SPRPGGEYCRQLGVAGRFNRAEGDAPTGGGASRVVWLSHRVLWEPPPRGRIAPAARSSRKVQSRRGRRSYRGWGQPGGCPRPGGEQRRQLGVAGRLDRAEGGAPADTPSLLYLPRRLSYRPENSISISEIRPWLLPLMIFSAPAKASGTPTSGMTSFSSWATAPWPGTPSATI